jgi:hypothetical protein
MLSSLVFQVVKISLDLSINDPQATRYSNRHMRNMFHLGQM